MKKITYFYILLIALFLSSACFAKTKTSFDLVWPIPYGAVTNQFECNSYQKAACLEGVKLFSMQRNVSAPSAGTIAFLQKTSEKGILIVIQSNDFYSIVYNLQTSLVKKGDVVQKGQKIGIMKDNMLGFELRDASGKSYDPEAFLPALPVTLKKDNTEKKKLDPRDKELYKNFSAFMKVHGFATKDIPKMYCIAVWESFLNPKAVNHNTNGTEDIGLFQINEIWEKPCGMDRDDLMDVQKNTKCALIVLNKQGISAWSTWKKFSRFCNLADQESTADDGSMLTLNVQPTL